MITTFPTSVNPNEKIMSFILEATSNGHAHKRFSFGKKFENIGEKKSLELVKLAGWESPDGSSDKLVRVSEGANPDELESQGFVLEGESELVAFADQYPQEVAKYSGGVIALGKDSRRELKFELKPGTYAYHMYAPCVQICFRAQEYILRLVDCKYPPSHCALVSRK